MRERTRKMVFLSLLAALSYVSMIFLRLSIMPAAPFLNYDPKDIVIVIGGFLYGPLASLLLSVVVAFLEMITVSDSGFIGFVMNALSSAAFTCTAALVYKYRRRLSGAVAGLVCGCLAVTATMLLWNYLITPIYQGIPREAVAAALLPVFLPFNLIKSGLNAALSMILYRPVAAALRLTFPTENKPAVTRKALPSWRVLIVSILVIAFIILILLDMQNKA
jgi:riboflavin transporter FmnP